MFTPSTRPTSAIQCTSDLAPVMAAEAKMLYDFSLSSSSTGQGGERRATSGSGEMAYYNSMLKSSYSYNSLGSSDSVDNDSSSQHTSSSRGGASTVARKASVPKAAAATPAKYSASGGEERRRMKVSIRCRPAFQDEIGSFRGKYFPIVSTKSGEGAGKGKYGVVELRQVSGKSRDFYYDNVFGEGSSQLEVYEAVARPVVEDVLRGYNGTIFAYGQTGSGKTFTMGILETVRSPQAGIIPRALQQLFEHRQAVRGATDVRVVLSFLQIYRETIQDLVGGSDGASPNLAIREERQAGFYVEGLSAHEVRSADEAFALLNLGLENRAIASTHMNSTSSRSHTILTLSVTQAPIGGGSSVSSKLLLVDLAGSERVRRSVSRGARLSEAKAINSSLSALGNVISALADARKAAHVPYRDSKLTRLLQDSLGGTAATSLICTVGPSPANYGETLGSLQFATRCMAVIATPVRHETVDYADLCANLQDRLNSVEGRLAERFQQQQRRYEDEIRLLQEKLQRASSSSGSNSGNIGDGVVVGSAARHGAAADPALEQVLSALGKHGSREQLSGWLQSLRRGDGAGSSCNAELVAILSYCFSALRLLSDSSVEIVEANRRREAKRREDDSSTKDTNHDEDVRLMETERMLSCDPLLLREGQGAAALNSHLAQLSRGAARAEAGRRYPGNSGAAGGTGGGGGRVKSRENFYDYPNVVELAKAINSLFSSTQANLGAASQLLFAKDATFQSLQSELADCYYEKRSRDEEVVNWSYILKYLLATNSNLKRELRAKATGGGGGEVSSTGGGSVEVSSVPLALAQPRPRRRSLFVDMSDVITHNTKGFAELQSEQEQEDEDEYRRFDVETIGGEEEEEEEALEGVMESLGIHGSDERDAARGVIMKVLAMTDRDIAGVADTETREQILAIRGAVQVGSPPPSPSSQQGAPLPAYLVGAPSRRGRRQQDERLEYL